MSLILLRCRKAKREFRNFFWEELCYLIFNLERLLLISYSIIQVLALESALLVI